MKSAPTNSRLDSFLSETLKGSPENFQPYDWSEVEVLLKHERPPIPITVDKKTIRAGAVAAGVIILCVVIYSISRHYASLPAETETQADTVQNTFSLIDTVRTAAPVPDALRADTTKKDSGKSVIAAGGIVPVQPAEKEISPAEKKAVNPAQKKRSDTLQTPASELPVLNPKPVPFQEDTASNPFKETAVETPVVPDTASRKPTPENNTPKKKKSKAKSTEPPPAEPKNDAPAAKPDSLKQ